MVKLPEGVPGPAPDARPTGPDPRQLGIANVGAAEQAEVFSAQAGVKELADQLAQAGERIMTREETVERARAYTRFEKEAAEELRRISTESDLSKRSTTSQYSEFLNKRAGEILGSHQGRGDSLAALSARLEQSRHRFAESAAIEGMKAEQKLVSDTLGKRFNSIVDRAYRTNERLDSLWKEVDEAVTDMSPALGLSGSIDASRIAKEKVGVAMFNRLFDNGAWGEAERLRDTTPEYGAIFGAEAQKSINHRILSLRQKEIEDSTKGIREARQKIIEAHAIASAVGGSQSNIKENFAKKLGLGPDKLSEFDKLSQEVIAMEQGGLSGTTEYKVRSARLAKLISSEQMKVDYDPNTGSFTLTQGGTPATLGEALSPDGGKQGAGLGSGLTSPQALVQSEKLDNLRDTIKSLDATIDAIVEEPSRAGIFGSVRRVAQTAIGVGTDLAQIVSGVTGIDINKLGMNSRSELISDKNIPASVKTTLMPYFDPKLSEMELFENTLAIQLAKLRILSGGSDIRAIESAFKIAQKDTKLTGLKSSQEVLTKLGAIKEEFVTSRDRLATRLGGNQQAQPNEREEKIRKIFGEK